MYEVSFAFSQERQSSVRELVPVLLAAAVHDHKIAPSHVAHIARSRTVAAALTVIAARPYFLLQLRYDLSLPLS